MVRKLYDSLLRYLIVRNSSCEFTLIFKNLCTCQYVIRNIEMFWNNLHLSSGQNSWRYSWRRRTISFTDFFNNFTWVYSSLRLFFQIPKTPEFNNASKRLLKSRHQFWYQGRYLNINGAFYRLWIAFRVKS